jgi:hypothetical protein
MANHIEPRPSAGAGTASPIAGPPGGSPASGNNLGDILERVLDKGIVIAGDIEINLLDIELLTIRLRLIVASIDTAREIGINWWETDPRLKAGGNGETGGRELEERIDRLEKRLGAGQDDDQRQLESENRRLRKRLERLERELAPADEEDDG